jgi:hypothetical protein
MTGTVTAEYLTYAGAPAKGTVTFGTNTTDQQLRDPDGNVVYTGPRKYRLVAGALEVDLPGTDDVAFAETGWQYWARIELDGAPPALRWFELPDGDTVDLADIAGELAPGDPLTHPLSYADVVADIQDPESVIGEALSASIDVTARKLPVNVAGPYPISISRMFNGAGAGYPVYSATSTSPIATSLTANWSDIQPNGNLDATIQANVGDWVTYTYSGFHGVGADYFHLDVKSVSGSAQRSWATGIAPNNSHRGAFDSYNAYGGSVQAHVTFAVTQQVKSTDLNGGYLTLRPCWRNESSGSATQTLYVNGTTGGQLHITVENNRSGRTVIAEATQAWEDDSGTGGGPGISEVGVYYDGQIWHVVYTGGIVTQAVGYATMESPMGPLDKHLTDPIFGDGNGGVAGTCARPSLYYESGVLHLFFSKGGSIYHAEGNLTPGSPVTFGAAAVIRTPVGTASGWENHCVTKSGSTYHMIAESKVSSAGNWKLGHLTASSLTGTWTVQDFPVTGLNIGSGGDANASGPWLKYDIDGDSTYHLWYHATLQGVDQIFRATSADCVTWTLTPVPVIQAESLDEQFQIADVWLETDGKDWYAWWEGVLPGNTQMVLSANYPARMPIIP